MTSMAPTAISEAIHARVFDQKKPVTARWICYEHMCNMCTAQMLLQQILNEHASEVDVTRLIDGMRLVNCCIPRLRSRCTGL